MDDDLQNVDDILEICQHGNKLCDRWGRCDDIHRDVLDLYSYGYDGSEDEAFYIYEKGVHICIPGLLYLYHWRHAN